MSRADPPKLTYIAPQTPSSVGHADQDEFLTIAHYHQRYCEVMVDVGYDVEFVHLGSERRSFQHEYGHTVVQLPKSGGTGFGYEFSLPLLRHLKNTAADLVHIHVCNQPNVLPILGALQLKDVRVVLQNHGAALDRSKPKVRVWYRTLASMLAPLDNLVLSVNQTEVENLLNAGVGQRVAYIPNAVDTRVYYPSDRAAARDRLGLSRDAQYGLYVGRMAEQKGLQSLVSAAALLVESLPDFHLLLVCGTYDAALFGDIQRICVREEITDHVHFVGKAVADEILSTDELRDYYAAADVFVAPSLTEGFGVVNLEAMACKRPVVGTTAHTEAKAGYMVDGENAVVAEPGSAESLASCLSSVLTDQSFAAEIAEAGYDYVHDQHTYEQVRDHLQQYYQLLGVDL